MAQVAGSVNAHPLGGLSASWGARDTRPTVGTTEGQGRQRFLGAEWTKEGFLEELALDRWLAVERREERDEQSSQAGVGRRGGRK